MSEAELQRWLREIRSPSTVQSEMAEAVWQVLAALWLQNNDLTARVKALEGSELPTPFA